MVQNQEHQTRKFTAAFSPQQSNGIGSVSLKKDGVVSAPSIQLQLPAPLAQQFNGDGVAWFVLDKDTGKLEQSNFKLPSAVSGVNGVVAAINPSFCDNDLLHHHRVLVILFMGRWLSAQSTVHEFTALVDQLRTELGVHIDVPHSSIHQSLPLLVIRDYKTRTTIQGNDSVTMKLRGSTGGATLAMLFPTSESSSLARIHHLEHQVKVLQMTAVPAGTIVMWHGAVAPAGWTICDGTKGAPDLRGRFPVGSTDSATKEYALGATGGSATHTHDAGTIRLKDYKSGSHITSDIVTTYRGGKCETWTHDPPMLSELKKIPLSGTTTSSSSLPPFKAVHFIMKL